DFQHGRLGCGVCDRELTHPQAPSRDIGSSDHEGPRPRAARETRRFRVEEEQFGTWNWITPGKGAVQRLRPGHIQGSELLPEPETRCNFGTGDFTIGRLH